MRVLFIRHGKDDGNYRGGWSKSDLTEEGKSQAKRLADYISANNRDFNITRIISSDLPRALSTAAYISENLNITVEHEALLREMNNGDLAGMLNEEAIIKYPGVFFNTLNMDEHYPNGESPLEFYSRIEQWFSEFCKSNQNEKNNAIVVTHGGVINVIYHIVNNMVWTNKSQPFKSSDCSLHILNFDDMQFEIKNFVAE